MNIRYIFIATFLLLFPFIANASVAGDVEFLKGEAWVERGGDKVSLQVGDSVDAGDIIVTTQSGRVKLVMKDDSKVYVGSQSRITIDDYEMRGKSLFSGSFNMLWGKVRFLVTKLKTNSASFSVHTKTATIGVRGTQFAVMLNKPSKPTQLVPTTVMLFEGAVVGKSIKGQVANIKPGTIVRLKPDGAILTRKIEQHDMRVLDIEPLALRKGLRPLKKGTALSSPTKLRTTTLISPTKLDSSTTLISPTRLESATLVKDPTLSTTTTLDPTLSTTTLVKDPTLSTTTTLVKDPALSTTSTTTLVKDPTLSTTTLTSPTTTTITSPTRITAPTTTTITSPTKITAPTTITSPTRITAPTNLTTTTNTLSTTTKTLSTTTTTIKTLR